MNAENFAKLTAILDLLDRYKKNLAQAVQVENPAQARHVLRSGRTLSKRSTRSEGLSAFGNANEGKGSHCLPTLPLSPILRTQNLLACLLAKQHCSSRFNQSCYRV